MSYGLFFEADAALAAGATYEYFEIFGPPVDEHSDEPQVHVMTQWTLGDVGTRCGPDIVSMQGDIAKAFGRSEEPTEGDKERLIAAAIAASKPGFADFVKRTPLNAISAWY